MQVPAACLHCHVLLRTDHVRHGRAFQRGADVEAPEFLERIVVISHDPTILQRREYQAACRGSDTRSDFNIRNGLCGDLVIDRVERRHRTVIEIAVIRALLAVLGVETAVRGQELILGSVLLKATFDAETLG